MLAARPRLARNAAQPSLLLVALWALLCLTQPALSSPTAKDSDAADAFDPTALPDCSDTPISVSQLQLAAQADVVVTGITLAAGPGAGRCDPTTGNLNIALDNSTQPATNFIVLGIQCVHKGLLSCRNNAEDTKDCLILIAAPNSNESAPCSLAQGERYQVYLQKQTNGCDGYYLSMYERVYHSVRRPLGGTGCTFYPTYPLPSDLSTRLNQTCSQPKACDASVCDASVSKSPCVGDPAVTCLRKSCPGKYMYFNAIMPEDTCYEVYSYATSGIPTNCYGRRYINNRIRQLAGNVSDPVGADAYNASATAATANASVGSGKSPAPSPAAGTPARSTPSPQTKPPNAATAPTGARSTVPSEGKSPAPATSRSAPASSPPPASSSDTTLLGRLAQSIKG
ncbi:hypothetical protein V8C86DRAFT_2874652 [Haematococcus lacustris]